MPTDLPERPDPKPPRPPIPVMGLSAVVAVLAMVAAMLFTTTFDSFPEATTPSQSPLPSGVTQEPQGDPVEPMTQTELERFGAQLEALFGTSDEGLVQSILADANRKTGCSVLVYRSSPAEDFNDPAVRRRVREVAGERGDEYTFLLHPILETVLLVQHCE